MQQEMEEIPEEYFQLLNSDNYITLAEVRKAILSAKLKKGCGTDHLYAEAFRNEASVCIFYSFFNYCFQNGTVLEQWQEGIISPIY